MTDERSESLIVNGYERLTLVGHGGTAAIFSAIRCADGEPVAIKLFDVGEDSAAHRQVAAMERLADVDGVLTLEEKGTTCDGRRFIVTPYCAAGSLSIRMERFGGLQPAEVSRIGIQIATALGESHRAGVLHRDIKPSNVLFGDDGSALVSDFGAASLTDTVTASETMAVTVLYTAPEVLTGECATERSDVYSLGVTLLSAVLGHHPFNEVQSSGADQAIGTVVGRICGEGIPDPATLGLPQGLAAVLGCATAHDPKDRYASADDLAAALGHVAESPERIPEGTTTRRMPRRRTGRAFVGAVLLAILVVSATVAWASNREGRPHATEFGDPVTAGNGALGPLYRQQKAMYVGRLERGACDKNSNLVEILIHAGPQDMARGVNTPWDAVKGDGAGTFVSYMPCDTHTGEARYFLGATGRWFPVVVEVSKRQYVVLSKRMRINENSPSPDYTVDDDVLKLLEDPSIYKGWTTIDQAE